MGDVPDILAMRDWLRDPANAEACATFPVDADRVASPGVYAWHGDHEAERLVGGELRCAVHPLYVDQAGSSSRGSGRASGATLKSAIARTHLRGSTQASSFRRSLAAVLWNELGLRCEQPKRLEPESNARLTAWMLEHLSVATLPVDDRAQLREVADYLISFLDPPLNFGRLANSGARQRLRKLRQRHFSLASADVDRIDRFMELRAFASAQDSGSEFLRRRLAQEARRLNEHWAS